jgi:ATP-dependent DNA helicase RecQ
VIDVLVGEKTEKVLRFGHHKLSTFGIGSDISKKEWRSYFRQLIALQCLKIDHTDFGVIKLGESSRSILSGTKQVSFRVDTSSARNGTQAKRTATNQDRHLSSSDATVLKHLKSVRLHLSQQRKIPPYMVFHDSTLRVMATERPQTLDELAAIPGVGAAKLATYGERFLAAIREAEL